MVRVLAARKRQAAHTASVGATEVTGTVTVSGGTAFVFHRIETVRNPYEIPEVLVLRSVSVESPHR